MNKPVIVFDILQAVVNSMIVTGINKVYFQAGRNIQILKELNDLDNSITYKDKKYPLVACVFPVIEERGQGYYCTVTINKIIIANFSNGTDNLKERYSSAGAFKTILYPCYYEFLKRLARSPNVIGGDPDAFEHKKMDNPSVQPLGEGSTDYIDSIEILNLKIILKQIKTC